ncbi:MAG: hypothetical protein PHT44_00945 [Candidatus Portnoybacteria bacterium]|nr:hypothetical protein [Candidatus Portnoybacteria bacterium]MDD4982822.1 hypothetical protein [Candidatus Portnoybacteria bacterium]
MNELLNYALITLAMIVIAAKVIQAVKVKIPSVNWKWSIPVQAAAAISLMTIICLFTFQKELVELWHSSKSTIVVIIAAAIGLLIGGDSLKTINVCRKIALIVLIVTIAYFGAKPKWFSPANPPPNLSSAAAQGQISARITGFNTELPAEAKLAAKVTPGQIVWAIRERMELPAPELWIKNLNSGEVRQQKAWPDGLKNRELQNTIGNNVEIYAVPLPDGQNVPIISYTRPTVNRLAQTENEQPHLLLNVVN